MRTNKVILVAGKRGTGKTDFIKNLAFKMSVRFPKVLVVDTFDSDVWHNLNTWNAPTRNINVPQIPVDMFKRWTKGVGRMFSGETELIMSTVQEHARNSFIIFEDATKYIGNKLTKDVKYFVLDSKQKNLDLVFIFHSLMAIPPDLIRVADALVLFKTNDNTLPAKYDSWPEIETMRKDLRESENRYVNKAIELN